jgi:hypothetical protein
MNKISFALLALSILFSPVAARADSVLPPVLTKALNDAAATGNPLVVEAVSDRLTSLFPAYKPTITAYVDNIATPATQVAAVAKDAYIPVAAKTDEDDIFNLQTSAGPENPNSLATELNNMDVGAGK